MDKQMDLLDKVLAAGGTFTADEVRQLLTLRGVATTPPPVKSKVVMSPKAGSCIYEWAAARDARVRHLAVAPSRNKHYCRLEQGHNETHECVCGKRFGYSAGYAHPTAPQVEVKLTPEIAGERDAVLNKPKVSGNKTIRICPHCNQPKVGGNGLAAHIMLKHPEFGTSKQKAANKILLENQDGRNMPAAMAGLKKWHKETYGTKSPADDAIAPLDESEQAVLAEITRWGGAGCTMREAAKAASLTWQKCEAILEKLVKMGALRIEQHGTGPATYVRGRKS